MQSSSKTSMRLPASREGFLSSRGCSKDSIALGVLVNDRPKISEAFHRGSQHQKVDRLCFGRSLVHLLLCNSDIPQSTTPISLQPLTTSTSSSDDPLARARNLYRFDPLCNSLLSVETESQETAFQAFRLKTSLASPLANQPVFALFAVPPSRNLLPTNGSLPRLSLP